MTKPEPAVAAAVSGETGKMIGFRRLSREQYKIKATLFDLDKVANMEKKIPLDWINEEGTGLNEIFFQYCLPLISGETHMKKENGLPRFARLRKVYAK